VAGNLMFLGWLLIWLLLDSVRVMTSSMEKMAMIFSMVREETIVSILGRAIDL
jgi:hypothetical protein